MFWHLSRRVAFVGGVRGVFRIGVGIRTHQVDARREGRFRFQLYATRADFTALNREEGARRVRHQVVGFGQLVQRTGDDDRTIVRHVFHARFVLFALRRREQFALGIGLRSRFKRFAVAKVRSYAVIKQIVNATAPGELGIITFGGGVRHAVVGFLIGPVITAAQGYQHFIPLRLILNVQPRLFLTVEDLIWTGGRGIF